MNTTASATAPTTPPGSVSAAIPRIAVFSRLPAAQWFDNLVRGLGEDKVVYSRPKLDPKKPTIETIQNFEKHRDFWKDLSQKRNTPVLVFVDEDLVESIGGGLRTNWNETYKQLLETLYKFTDKFAVVKIHAYKFTVGLGRIQEQLLFENNNPANLSKTIKSRAKAFHKLRENTPVLGLKQGKPSITEFLEVFMNEAANLLPNTKS